MANFPEVLDGMPVWRLQVADPQEASEAPFAMALRVLPFPDGAILAAAAALSDQPGRPQRFHQCVSAVSLEARTWVKALLDRGALKVIFERKGWASQGERVVSVQRADAEALAMGIKAGAAPVDDGNPVALAYLETYREAIGRLQDPRAVWDEIQARLQPPVAAKRSGGGLWWLLLLLLAAAAAYWFITHRA